MNDALTPLLWCGGVGWFMLTYVLGLGGSKSAGRVLVWTVFYWLIVVDPIAIVFGIAGPIVHRTGIGWRFVVLFVALPFLLCVLRLRWLRARRPGGAPASPSIPTV